MKLYSAYYSGGYPFDQLPFEETITTSDPRDLTEKGALVIWGGADISPSIYGKRVSKRTHAGQQLSKRDIVEVDLAKQAIAIGMPIIGVCRGAQLLCGLAGGHLIQHVNNHGGTHTVVTNDGQEFVTNSIHHQMMYPFDVKHEIRAFMRNALSDVYVDVDDNGKDIHVQVPVEPEYVYFPTVKGYAVQWHPEGMSIYSEANQYLLSDLRKELFQ